jgi:LmbE family N-acetylglucosaminyl deacetylase
VATAVFFHAHPDDECILTGGTMAKLAADGHRVVLVCATRGEHGEVDDGVLGENETLAERRTVELKEAADVLGVARLEFLGYVDSGMMGTPTNDAPDSFWQADLGEAADRLTRILTDEEAAALVIYDDHGGYGHPDHIQVHRVGVQAGQLATTSVIYEASIDRDRMIAGMRAAREAGDPALLDEEPDENFGVPSTAITTRVDVSDYVAVKRQAMACHRSQISESSFFLSMPEQMFTRAFGTEEFIRRGAPEGTEEDALDLRA